MATKQEWLYRVASAAAGNIGAGTPEEALGGTMGADEIEDLSKAEYARLEWAIEQVQSRLYRMGKRTDW
jgi:hypothetical protein